MTIKKEYIKKEKCIWCLKTKPHTIPKTLNNENIGFDICDDCNSYFGSDDKENIVPFSIDKVSKEFINIHKFLLERSKNSESWKELKSQFFNYYHKSEKIKINVDYIRNPAHGNEFTRKFKRGIYNMFLQELHRVTESTLEKKYDIIRDFVRYNKGDIPLLYLVSNNGIRMCEDLEKPLEIVFNDNTIDIINKYGFYLFRMTGLHFYLLVTEDAYNNIDKIINESNQMIGSGFVFKELIELKKINQIDFTLSKWNK